MKTHTKLTKTERVLLSQWKKEGLSNIECGRRLGRDKSTIGRELKRNKTKVRVGKYDESIYEPEHAQIVTEDRKQHAFNAKQPLKNSDVYSYVLDHLRQGWSPEAIAGRLSKEDHKGDPHWHICHETIYRFVYAEKTELTRQGLITAAVLDGRLTCHIKAVTITDFNHPLYEYLRRKQTKRRKKSGRKVHRSHIPDRVSIQKRPEIINERKEFGHWEGDTVEGVGHKDGIHTEVERLSRFISARKVKGIDSKSALDAQLQIFSSLPKKARKSTTLDNGRETHLHFKLRDDVGMQTYHADPYSSYQRGTNEHANGLIRCYFPKGTDFTKVTDEELADVLWEINNRPRKVLQYKTAQEVFDMYLNL
ncbi:MAG: IS30 family transposase [Rhabdochlamydiaceae bacterium]